MNEPYTYMGVDWSSPDICLNLYSEWKNQNTDANYVFDLDFLHVDFRAAPTIDLRADVVELPIAHDAPIDDQRRHEKAEDC